MVGIIVILVEMGLYGYFLIIYYFCFLKMYIYDKYLN